MCIAAKVKKTLLAAIEPITQQHAKRLVFMPRPGRRTETLLTIDTSPATRDDALAMDGADPLRRFKDAFDLPTGVIYLDGNSLGPPPRLALARIQQTAQREWAADLITSWNSAGWFEMPIDCGAKIATLIGAPAEAVAVADSVSINVFKLAAALYEQKGGPIRIFENEFPTDGYILQGFASLTGATLQTLKAGADPFGEHGGLLVLSVVDYKSAEIVDIAAMEARAKAAGVSIIWDLSHATGLLPLNLHRDGARYAVGCGYKYLNGGPGAPAFIYAQDDAGALNQPLTGWMGHEDPFAFETEYRPADNARQFVCGTPPILSMSALDAALDVFTDIELTDVAMKARRMGDLFLTRALNAGLDTVSPPPGAPRGGHVSLCFDHGYEVVQALIARGVIGDFRAPNLMRFGFSPLYLSYADIWDAGDALIDVLRTEVWRDPQFARRDGVT